jgi:hypothetical protein
MANRYWVGASGAAWGVTSSWSATSGGAPGASVPFTSDNAIFDQATTYTVNCSSLLQVIDFTVSAGTVTFTGTGGLNFTGNFFLSSGTIFGTSASPLGNIGLFPTAAKTITTSGTVIEALMAFAAGAGGSWQLQDALTLGSARTFQLSAGRVDLNNKAVVCGFFNSNYTTTRGVDYGTSGSITSIGAGGAMVNINAASGWSTTGTQVNNVSYSGSTAVTIVGSNPAEATAVSFNITAGTYALTILSQNRNYLSLDFTGFAGTVVAPFGGNIIYGDLTLSSAAGFSIQASVGILNFGSTSATTRTITTNSKTLDLPITFNGVGGTWRLNDALTMGAARTLTHTNGTIDLNGKTLTVGTAYTTAAGTKNLTFNAGTLVCPTAAATAFNNAAPTGYTTTAGTGTGKISMTAATAKSFVGGGSTFNCTLSNDGAGALTITGANTFSAFAAGVTSTATLPISITTTITTTSAITGTPTATLTLTSATSGTTTTINYTGTGTPRGNYMALRDLIFTPGPATNGTTPYTWYVGANSTNNGNNSGAAFVTYPQVVYQITNPATTSWTVPSDFNPSNNALYLIGAGGGGAGSLNATTHWNGGGGGGGGYTGATNIAISGSVTVAAGIGGNGGAVGSNGTAGTTTTFGSYSAGGGGAGTTGTAGSTAGGAGGTGTTYNGGRGGGVSNGSSTQGNGGAGGGGAAGPNGAGGAGGYNTSPGSSNAGAGGGGNGGGAAGSNAAGAVPGGGGNGYLGTGGGGTTTATSTGTNGGGGGGTYVGALPGFGSAGLDILNTVGSAGGGGGYVSSTAATARAGVNYGAGGSGAAVSNVGVTSAGGAGGSGLIVITYTPGTGNFFFMF